MAELSKTARRSMVQGNAVRTPFQVFKPTKPGKANHPVASFASREDAEAFAAEIGGYVFTWRDEAR
jgi:nitrous oxide reductase accessory protein NosL